MKPYLPYNILLVLALATCGLVALYNLVLRETYVTTLRYSYPAIESQSSAASQPDYDPERIEPESEEDALGDSAGAGTAMEESLPEEPSALTRVEFPLDINTATVEQLKFIPQVGDVMAQRIVQYREVLDGYTDLEQLKGIKGVGDKTYERLWAYLYISEDGEPYGGEPSGQDEEPEEAGDETESPVDDWDE